MTISKIKTQSKVIRLSLIALIISFIVSCNSKLDERYVTTFTGDMVYSYLKKDSLDSFSEFIKFVDYAGLKGMLSAYGEYTCLAPTNEAFNKFYSENGFQDFEAFKNSEKGDEEIHYIARTHIINKKYLTEDLTDGIIPNVNMNDRVIEIDFSADSISGQLKILLNKEAEVLEKDIEVYNGVIYTINSLIAPSNAQLPYLIELNEDLSIFAEALFLTGMNDSLLLMQDDTYDVNVLPEYKDEYNSYTIPPPPARKYGYTAFVESNDVYAENGIFNIDDLIAQAAIWYDSDPGVGADDYTNRGHSLNKFVSYHLIEKIVNANSFFFDRSMAKDVELYEFLETMYTNRIMKVANKSENSLTLGVNNAIINPNSTNELFVTNENKTTVNGVYHVLDDILIYSDGVEEMLTSTRIRFDMTALLPEMMNNNLRFSQSQNNSSGDRYGIPPGYFKYIEQSEHTRFMYLASKDRQFHNFQGDEMMGLGTYDITLRLLPVPPGTYELRFGYSGNVQRSVTQIYIDGKPIGIPLDLRMRKTDTKIGWKPDSETDDGGVEIDKAMRNRGWMNAPVSMVIGSNSTPLRAEPYPMRRIVGIFTFDDYEPHYIRFRSVLERPDAQAQMDYYEFVPKSIYEPIGGEPETRD